MSSVFHRIALLISLALGTISPGWAGMTSYTDPGKTDFDTAIQLINPYGTWSKVGDLWAFTPLNHAAPYTHGQWVYTEYGWYWKGAEPESWVTEHYGYWQHVDGAWSWVPAPFWLPYIVEFRSTTTHVGWHAGPVDNDGNFIEAPAARYAKPEEWTFVSMAQFAGPITPGLVAKPDVAARLLDDSSSSTHTYVTYRTIDRGGPHPADFVALAPDSLAFAPSLPGAATLAPPRPASTPGRMVTTMVGTTNAPSTNAPAAPLSDDGQPADPRQVKYWITMSLPDFWTKAPPDGKLNELYLYRPEFFQDRDGIQRRVELWLHPEAREAAMANLTNALDRQTSTNAPGHVVPPPTPKPHDPFASPFDDHYHSTGGHIDSSKSPGDPRAPVPPPTMDSSTNAAPSGR